MAHSYRPTVTPRPASAVPGEQLAAHSADPDAYVARVIGNWMAPRVRHGEYIVASPAMTLDPGDDVFVQLKDGRNMLKRLAADLGEAWELVSLNDAGQPVIILKAAVKSIHGISSYMAAKTETWRRAKQRRHSDEPLAAG
jgi:SOS-response transcriptional repressor LexA